MVEDTDPERSYSNWTVWSPRPKVSKQDTRVDLDHDTTSTPWSFDRSAYDHSLRFEGAADYCRLLYSSNSLDPIAKRLNEGVRKAGTRAGQHLAFLEIENRGPPFKCLEPDNDPVLAEYRHFLERRLRIVPHLLTEEEERIIMAKDQNGSTPGLNCKGIG